MGKMILTFLSLLLLPNAPALATGEARLPEAVLVRPYSSFMTLKYHRQSKKQPWGNRCYIQDQSQAC